VLATAEDAVERLTPPEAVAAALASEAPPEEAPTADVPEFDGVTARTSG
jgi:hypothetical protein